MGDFISEEELQTWEGFLKGQGVNPATLMPADRKEWEEIFKYAMECRANAPKVGLMKLRSSSDDEKKYAVALRDGSNLWLTFWVRCSSKGEIFILYPRTGPSNPHASYHLDGTFHQKSDNHAFIPQKRQPLTGLFRGAEHLGIYYGHGKSTGAVCDADAFDGLVIVEPGVLGPRNGSVAVDVLEPGLEPPNYANGHQQEVFSRGGRPSVVITILRS